MALKLNLGTEHGASVQEVINLCREVTGHPIPARKVGRREGDPPALVADASAAKRELGWHARYSMREIVESAWAWHRRHPRGFGD
jgi:UDP-glucose 4-epimerase